MSADEAVQVIGADENDGGEPMDDATAEPEAEEELTEEEKKQREADAQKTQAMGKQHTHDTTHSGLNHGSTSDERELLAQFVSTLSLSCLSSLCVRRVSH